jgi:CPA1 family monovalent cation:H+ antiporter
VTTLQIAALIVSLTAVLAYVNARFVKLPSQIGLLAISLGVSLIIVALDKLGVIDAREIVHVVAQANFGPVLLHGMLGLLLFAGALHIQLGDLREHQWPVAVLSVGGTLLSTALVGFATYGLLAVLGHAIPLVYALLFGALISPTDPIAVLGVLKSSRVPRPIEIVITGESLFNDGVGVVVVTVLLAAASGTGVTGGHIAYLFVREALGGAVFGLVAGWLADRLLTSIDDYMVEVLITLALVLGGYALAESLEVSAPIAAVVAGIVVGNRTTRHGMSDTTRQHVAMFWQLVDEVLNAVLFLMLGLEATRLHVSPGLAIAAAVAVPIVLASRWISVAASSSVLRPFMKPPPHAVTILTWGGLRGGLAVALALALPSGPERDAILVITYAVVSFSILVQGLTLSPLLRRLGLAD